MSRFETAYGGQPQLRAALHLVTPIGGMSLTIQTTQTVLRCWLAWHGPIERCQRCLVVLPIIGDSIYGALMPWTFWLRRRLQHPKASRNTL